MFLHTFVPYWGVIGMYLKLVWMMGIPMMWTWNQSAIVTSLTTFTNYGAWVSMEFGFCLPIEFDTMT
jgi:hypothetical protein